MSSTPGWSVRVLTACHPDPRRGGLRPMVKMLIACGGTSVAGIGQLADVPGRLGRDDGGVEIRIVLDRAEPPAGCLQVVRASGQTPGSPAGQDIRSWARWPRSRGSAGGRLKSRPWARPWTWSLLAASDCAGRGRGRDRQVPPDRGGPGGRAGPRSCSRWFWPRPPRPPRYTSPWAGPPLLVGAASVTRGCADTERARLRVVYQHGVTGRCG
jgi:hypothetical protein